MKRGNFIFALSLECIGIFVLVYSYKLGLQKITNPGPGLFPFLLGIFLCLVVLPALFESFKKSTELHPVDKTIDTQALSPFVQLCVVILCLFEFFFLLEILGFVIAIFLFLFGLFWVGNPGRWVFNSLISIGTVLVTYLMFNTLLQVALPLGILK
jgi:hypothetical protein